MTENGSPLLSREETIEVARTFAVGSDVAADDPLPKVPPSLLSADHIVEYVRNTGMVYPFYTYLAGKPKLKSASYEGGIGDQALLFGDSSRKLENLFETQNGIYCLKLPANSISFVKCDIEFRLPVFIAVRFNLQIQHVHRGLLLGTGPLVDPGFWGQLCIPIHNLTDEDYYIPSTEGLIWMEFTKTTGINREYGALPFGDTSGSFEKRSDIRRYLRKASDQFEIHGPVAIRSSLPNLFAEAKFSAEAAQRGARRTAKWVYTIGTVYIGAGVIGALLIVIALWNTWYRLDGDVYEFRESFRDELQLIRTELGDLEDRMEGISGSIDIDSPSAGTQNRGTETERPPGP